MHRVLPRSYRISTKLALLVGLVTAAMVVLGGFSLWELHSQALASRLKLLRSVNEMVRTEVDALAGQVSAGHMTHEQALARLAEVVRPLRYDDGRDLVVLQTEDGTFLTNSNPALVGNKGESMPAPVQEVMHRYLAAVHEHGEVVMNNQLPRSAADRSLTTKLVLAVGVPSLGVVVATASAVDDIEAAFLPRALQMGGLSFAAVGVIASLTWLIGRSIRRPVQQLTRSMQSLAAGDLAVEVTGQLREDEVGAMAKAVQVFKAASVEKRQLEERAEADRAAGERQRAAAAAEREAQTAQQTRVVETLAAALQRLSAGDLTCHMAEPFAPEYERLRADFNSAVGALRSTVGTIVESISGIRGGSSEISQAADDLSRRTEQQAASLEQTAAALDEITATVRRTAEGATAAQSLMGAAKQDAQSGEAVVRDAVAVVGAIEESARKISDIIGVIDEIAFQTSLLSLNAGVEAARAGEAGRGFAVVASEVRALAQRSAGAAKEIKVLINTSASHVDRGVTLVRETGDALDRILGRVRQIDGVVGEIASSAHEQASGLSQVNTAINQMDQVTQQNAAMVEQSTAASHSLAQDTATLEQLTAQFRTA